MSYTAKRLLRDWLPPVLLRVARRHRSQSGFRGDYRSWAEAMLAAGGYAAPAILEKAIAATRAVRDGTAAFERDTVLFREPEVHGPLLAGLLRAAALQGGRLHVVDVGGAMGSVWWQHRGWFAGLTDVTWEVVEQMEFVVAGRREFETGPLRFRESLAACRAKPREAVALLSSVLPYLEKPHALLSEIASLGFGQVLIDRTGFLPGRRDRLTVQHVPAAVYDASYPCWFFARENLLATLGSEYRVVAEWQSFDAVDFAAEFRGLLLERISR